MKLFLGIIFSSVLISCTSESPKTNSVNENVKSESVNSSSQTEVTLIDATILDGKISDSSNYELCYVTVADTGSDYFLLHKLMNELAPAMKLPIDTFGKEFNIKKLKIALPENDEDEMYRGEYYPRRYTGNALSLEYLNFYFDLSTDKNIALVTSICSNKDSAFYYAKMIPQGKGHPFVVRANVYVGCMH